MCIVCEITDRVISTLNSIVVNHGDTVQLLHPSEEISEVYVYHHALGQEAGRDDLGSNALNNELTRMEQLYSASTVC